jgi:hypothetical protein
MNASTSKPHAPLFPLPNLLADVGNDEKTARPKTARDFILHPNDGYALCERPVKLLLNGYLLLFSQTNISATATLLGCTVYRIPDAYYRQGNLIKAFDSLPAIVTKTSSLYRIPETSKPLEFKRMPLATIRDMQKLRKDILEGIDSGNEEVVRIAEVPDPQKIEFQQWQIYLEIYDEGQLPAPESLDIFENDKHHIRLMIEGAFLSAQAVFANYRAQCGGLDQIKLEFDKEKLCLYLIDDFFHYTYGPKISFRLEKQILA